MLFPAALPSSTSYLGTKQRTLTMHLSAHSLTWSSHCPGMGRRQWSGRRSRHPEGTCEGRVWRWFERHGRKRKLDLDVLNNDGKVDDGDEFIVV